MAFLSAAAPQGQPDATVNTLVAAVRAGLAAKQPDKALAKSVGKLKVGERIDAQVLEELESEGAGPATLEELARLQEESQGERPPQAALPFTSPAKPTVEEMRIAVQAVRVYALGYAGSLPDFLCAQSVKRYEDRGPKGHWRLLDTLVLQLGYSEQREDYKLVSVNDHPAKESYAAMKGAVTQGEFGSMMYAVFHPASHARVTWDHWTKLHGRPVQVYAFAISRINSAYELAFGEGQMRESTMAGAAGEIYVNPENNTVVKLTRRATEVSPNFPITAASTVLTYEHADVGGRQYLLPVHAVARMETLYMRMRNEVDFTGYRKFSGESTISFGDPAEPVVKK
jgi:hypothetical protein